MPLQRIMILKDKRPSPTGFDLLLSSKGLPWRGFQVEEHVSPPEGSQQRWCYPKTHIVLNTDGGCDFEYTAGSRTEHFSLGRDTVSILPEGFEMTFAWRGVLRFMVVEIDPQIVATFGDRSEGPSCTPLAPQLRLTDSTLVSLLRCIREEIQQKCPSGQMYGEALSLALLAYVQGRFSTTQDLAIRDAQAITPLSKRQQRVLLEYINAAFSEDLSISDLAAKVGLSPTYFCRAFRRTFGQSPHQYLLKVRVENARELLARQRIPIADIANRVGFSSQSHLTATFRKYYGVTPRTYRQQF